MENKKIYSELEKQEIEINSRIKTLDFMMSVGKIDAQLYRMKRKTMMYEIKLIHNKTDELINMLKIDKMCQELNIKTISSDEKE